MTPPGTLNSLITQTTNYNRSEDLDNHQNRSGQGDSSDFDQIVDYLDNLCLVSQFCTMDSLEEYVNFMMLILINYYSILILKYFTHF